MNTLRRNRLVKLALDYLYNRSEIAEEQFLQDAPDLPVEPTRIALEVPYGSGSRIIFSPTVDELKELTESGRNGNWRTKELVYLAIQFLQANLEDISYEYPYEGEVERFLDTHVSNDGENFLAPTTEELEEIVDDLDKIVKSLPAITTPQIAWDVYGPVEDEDDGKVRLELIDTVFYNANCDQDYVTRSLIDHDGYDPSIVCVS